MTIPVSLVNLHKATNGYKYIYNISRLNKFNDALNLYRSDRGT